MSTLFAILMSVLAIFLNMLVLVQRGRGGGLAGALGGMGGSSAFGAKAGDMFTRITIVTAAIWIAVCIAAVYWAGHQGDALSIGGGGSAASSPLDTAPPLGGGPVNQPGLALPTNGAKGTATPPAEQAPPSNATAPAANPPSSPPAQGAPADAK
jgi:preprotein translocase subunit SecG